MSYLFSDERGVTQAQLYRFPDELSGWWRIRTRPNPPPTTQLVRKATLLDTFI